MKKLAIISTHPIQYYAPLFKLLAQESGFEIKVFYTWSQKQKDSYDRDFGKNIEWDIPLLEGYNYTFVENTSKDPGTHHFMGIKCPDLIKEIEDWQATHVLVFGWNFHAHLQAMRHFKGKIPVWFRGDSHLLDEQPGIRKVLRRIFLNWVYSYVDKALYVGTNNKKYYLKHGLKKDQLIFAPHAIDNQRFSEPNDIYEKKASDWRKELCLKPEDSVILFCGKFEPKKNPELLLEAFLMVKKQEKPNNLKIIFAGNGKLESVLKEKAQSHPDIHFLPFQNQSKMPIVYRLANIYCLPSKGPGETWGLAINEALACGRPILTSDKVGCAIDLVQENNGKIFKNNDINSLQEAIAFMIRKEPTPEVIKESIHEWSFHNIKETIKNSLTS
jgi:glycosyltransferase involved in cell wall biosynthesis